MSSESPSPKKPRPKTAREGDDRTPTSLALDGCLIASFLALTFLLGVFPLKDTDFWWHLRTGDLIRQTGQIPRTDPYTFTALGSPWIDLHWVFQVALSWGFQHGGVVGLNLSKCAITCAAVSLLITARRRDWPVWAVVVAWLPAILVLGGRMYVRPETLSLLFLASFLAILLRWDRRPMLTLLLPVVQAVWVNTQGLFVLGPIVLAFALIDAALRPGAFAPGRRRWWRVVAPASVLTGLACLFNPYGLAGALYPVELARTMGNPIFTTSDMRIAELTPIPVFVREAGWHNLPLLLHVLTVILGALSFLVPLSWSVVVRARGAAGPTAPERPKAKPPGRARKKAKPGDREPAWRLSPFRLLLFAAFSLLSWRATRNSHQFAAVVGTVTAWNFAEWVAALRRRRTSRGLVLVPRLAAHGCVALVFAAVASGTFYELTGEGRTIGLGEEPLWYPHAGVKFAGRLGMPERFLAYHIGHNSLYEYEHGPGRKVFADARLEVIGADLYERYVNLERRIVRDAPGWQGALDDAGRPAVLVSHVDHAGVGATLLGSARWRCVWFDPVAAVFVHDAYAAVVQTHAVDFAARHFRPDPATDPGGITALRASALGLRNYITAISPARADLSRPLILLGLDHARRLRQADPDGADGWKLLGQLEFFRDPPTGPPVPRYRLAFDPVFDLSAVRATYALRRALEAVPGDFSTLMILTQMFESRSMDEAVLPILDRLVALRPINRLQREKQAELGARRSEIRNRVGPIPRRWENLSELDQIVTEQLATGRAGSAAEVIERAYPSEPRPWVETDRLAALRLHLGEPQRARAFWEHAVRPPRPAVRAARVALTHLVEGAFEAARRGYRDALSLDPGLFEAHYGLAVLEQDVGNAPAALASARQAVTHAPNEVARSASRAIATLVTPYADGESSPRRPQSTRRGTGGVSSGLSRNGIRLSPMPIR